MLKQAFIESGGDIKLVKLDLILQNFHQNDRLTKKSCFDLPNLKGYFVIIDESVYTFSCGKSNKNFFIKQHRRWCIVIIMKLERKKRPILQDAHSITLFVLLAVLCEFAQTDLVWASESQMCH